MVKCELVGIDFADHFKPKVALYDENYSFPEFK